MSSIWIICKYLHSDICEANALIRKISVSIVLLHISIQSQSILCFTRRSKRQEEKLLLIENRNHDSRFVTRDSKWSIDMFKLIESIDGHPLVTNWFEIHIFPNHLHSIHRPSTTRCDITRMKLKRMMIFKLKHWKRVHLWSSSFSTQSQYMKLIMLWNVEDENGWNWTKRWKKQVENNIQIFQFHWTGI